MVDANHAYNVGAARRILKAIEPAHIHWFEEPISPEDIDGYKELKNLTDIYLAAGENEFTKFGFREWISRRAVDILQPDLCSAGGFTECRKISALAQAWHMPIVPHVWGSGIAQAASLQFLATLPPAPLALHPIEPMLEFDQSAHPFRQDLIGGAITIDGRDGPDSRRARSGHRGQSRDSRTLQDFLTPGSDEPSPRPISTRRLP